MNPRILDIRKKLLVGEHVNTNLIKDRTGELWKNFGPKIKHIHNISSSDKYSLQIYPKDYFKHFNPHTKFTKWAAVEVQHINSIPAGMETLTINAGLYAIFHYIGSSTDKSIFNYIYGEWIPKSGYVLDDRPHFEVLGKKYRNNDSSSEEDIYIPIKKLT